MLDDEGEHELVSRVPPDEVWGLIGEIPVSGVYLGPVVLLSA